MAKNECLHRAKDTKNDEFYTRLNDVENELEYYRQHFNDKIILCNCDDPTKSAFWEYFHINFTELGLRKLISTHYDKENLTYQMEYDGGNDNDINVGVVVPLKGNGDFRSKECLDLLDECDIVVTNPPFSLAREYMKILIEHNKKFIIIGDLNWITYKEIFPLLKNNQVWLGYNLIKGFMQPDGSIKKFGNKYWYTNLDIPKRHEELNLCNKYIPDEYPKYDNYDAINVNKVSDIPYDYDGVMGVPITFMDKYNPNEFNILGFTSPIGSEFGIGPSKIYSNVTEHSPNGEIKHNNNVNTRPALLYKQPPSKRYYTADNANGYLVNTYVRLLIQKRTIE